MIGIFIKYHYKKSNYKHGTGRSKLQFRVFNPKTKRYLEGYNEAHSHFLGFANDPLDNGLPDTYLRIERVDKK
jgi:hypothetical protein